MNPTTTATRFDTLPAVRQARAEALLTILQRRGGRLALRWWEMQSLRDDGWTRAALERAADDLAGVGLVEVRGENGSVTIYALSEPTEAAR